MHARLLARASALLHVPRSRPPWCCRLRVTTSVGSAGGVLIRSAGSSGGSMAVPSKPAGNRELEIRRAKKREVSEKYSSYTLRFARSKASTIPIHLRLPATRRGQQAKNSLRSITRAAMRTVAYAALALAAGAQVRALSGVVRVFNLFPSARAPCSRACVRARHVSLARRAHPGGPGCQLLPLPACAGGAPHPCCWCTGLHPRGPALHGSCQGHCLQHGAVQGQEREPR